jgi:hypothetical protein
MGMAGSPQTFLKEIYIMDQEQVQVVVVMKKCSNKDCGEVLPADTDHFPKNKSSRDGLGHWCKKCHSVYRTKKAGKVASI